MKTMKFLAMALVALTIASCSKEAETTDTTVPGSKAQIIVNIVGQVDNASKRSTGPSDNGTTEVVIKNFIVFLFNDGGGLIGTPKYQGSADKVVINDATTAAKKIYVVANTGVIPGGSFEDVKSLADLKTRTGDLIKDNASTQTKTDLWMAGSGDVGEFTKGATPEAPSTAKGTVELKFVAAKIDVVIKDQRNHTEPATGIISIKDDQVALLFAGSTAKFFETEANQAKQTTFYSGIHDYDNPKTATVATVLADKVTNKFKANDSGVVEYHFYTFGNDGEHLEATEKVPTILTIQSTRTDANGKTKSIYYPVHFSATDTGNTIVPGQQYLVVITLTGDVNNGGGGGTTDPEEELKSAEIEVSVTPAQWKTQITVEKTFN